MSQPDHIQDRPSSVDRYELADRLEVAAKKLDGQRLSHFVDTRSLCLSCREAIITRLASRNNRQIRCGALGRVVPDNIVECTAYRNITQLSLSQMVEIAYLIDNRKDRQGGYL